MEFFYQLSLLIRITSQVLRKELLSGLLASLGHDLNGLLFILGLSGNAPLEITCLFQVGRYKVCVGELLSLDDDIGQIGYRRPGENGSL